VRLALILSTQSIILIILPMESYLKLEQDFHNQLMEIVAESNKNSLMDFGNDFSIPFHQESYYDDFFLSDFNEKIVEMYKEVGPSVLKLETFSTIQIDAEVGDDHISLTDAPCTFISEVLTAKELFSVDVSIKDTFISTTCGNFSESFILTPQSAVETYSPHDPTNKDTIYLDILKIRLCLPVVNMRQTHSSTLDGKVSLSGKTASYHTDTCGPLVSIGLCIQNICLNLNREIKFPYFPTYLGGFGGHLPFQTRTCLAHEILSYKNGLRNNYLFTIVSKVFEFWKENSKSSKATLSELKSNSENWFDWLKAKTTFNPHIAGKVPIMYEKYRVGQYGRDETFDNIARRLLSVGVFTTDQDIIIHEALKDVLLVLLGEENPVIMRELIEIFRYEMDPQNPRNHSAYKVLCDKIEILSPDFVGDEEMTTFLLLTDGRNELLRNTITNSKIYWKPDFGQVSLMKVGLNIEDPKYSDQTLPQVLYKSYVIDDETQALINWVEGVPEGTPISTYIENNSTSIPRDILSDDSIILNNISQWLENKFNNQYQRTAAIIVTRDSQLCFRVNRVLGLPIFRIDPLRSENQIIEIKRRLEQEYILFSFMIEYDLGSIQAANRLVRHDNLNLNVRSRVFNYLSLKPFWNSRRIRKPGIQRIPERILQPDDTYDCQGVLRGRENRPYAQKSYTKTTGNFSWRKTEG